MNCQDLTQPLVTEMNKRYLLWTAVLLAVITFSAVVLLMSQESKKHEDHALGGRAPLPPPEEIAQLPPDGGTEFNRLIFEKSPYLLQHARNPVDWYPWGDAAFERARREDKPIFLSIGYSTCHWCHVMEHESFEDPKVARLMNETFINIKVDREERPDVDNIYMTVCQAMTGSGGWPLTIVMTPDKKPFFAATYIPKEARFGRPGMVDLIPRIGELWENNRQKLLESADKITEFLQQTSRGAPGEAPQQTVLDTGFQQLASRFDQTHGGFGSAPKFPSPHNFAFLLRYWHRSGEDRALRMVEKTLQAMRLGGIFDHVGFGFHRYSTDEQWLLPHFEKMLYDQAMMALAYVETYQATGKEFYARTAREIFTYVIRDMTAPEGGFYSAEDADSEGEEGLFYLWTPEEIKQVVGEEDGARVIDWFNVEPGGNFVEQATGQRTGRSILHLRKPLAKLAEEAGMSTSEAETWWAKTRDKLFEAREKRVHPLKDDKVLTDWNGLMIAALAKGTQVLGEERYEQAARRAADFVLETLRDDQGRLLKRYRQGEASLPAHVDDYAFIVWGLLELYEATFDVGHLENAIALNKTMLKHFWDDKNGGLFFSPDTLSELIVRTKEVYDGAIPSGNSVAAMNLLRIGRITGEPELEEKAMNIARAFSDQVQRAPAGHTQLLSALDFAFGPSFEVVIAGQPETKDTEAMVRALMQHYEPNKVVIFRPGQEKRPRIVNLAPFTEAQLSLNGQATAYVCRNYACKAPTTDIDEMLAALTSEAASPSQ